MELEYFILDCLKTKNIDNAPRIVIEWMNYSRTPYTEMMYKNMLTKVNRHLKQMEKYGLVRYTGRTISANNKAKIWEAVF